MKRKSRNRAQEICPEHWKLLNDIPLEGDAGDNWFAEHTFREAAPKLWTEHRDTILARWIAERPGTRPSCWWRFDAPRDTAMQAERANWFYAGDLIQGRRQLGGSGVPAWEKYPSTVPAWEFGIPHMDDIDDSDPPRFETERAYLERHGLLTEAEACA